MTPQIVTDTSRRSRANNAERRTRLRLRELCDEVLASYRLAKRGDVFAEDERNEARAILARITPFGRA